MYNLLVGSTMVDLVFDCELHSFLVGPARIELATSGLKVRSSTPELKTQDCLLHTHDVCAEILTKLFLCHALSFPREQETIENDDRPHNQDKRNRRMSCPSDTRCYSNHPDTDCFWQSMNKSGYNHA